MSHQARLAVEWFNASGERTADRLQRLVDHWCDQRTISDVAMRDAIYREAREMVRFE